MPFRKSSASLAASASTTLKPHRSHDSNRVWNQQVPLSSGPPQNSCILALVNRLKNKLPCNSGLSLDRVEADKATQQAIETLVQLSHDSIDVLAWTLADLLHSLTKRPVNDSGHQTVEVLQSQLFILKILAATLASRWHAKSFGSGPTAKHGSNSSLRSASTFEPPPLNDQCAKYILLVMVLFLRQANSLDAPTMMANRSLDVAFRDYASDLQTSTPSFELHDEDDQTLKVRPPPSIVSAEKHAILRLPIVNPTYEKTNLALVNFPSSLILLISEYAGRIVFHVSASNWNLVLERIQEKIRHEEDTSDLLPIQLLAHSALDRQRLVQVLNELSSLLITMGKEAQKAVALALREAIWHWIDCFPEEFIDAIRTKGRTEGAPERVFDLLHSLNPTGNEKIFWPTSTILCCITSERISTELALHQFDSKPGRKACPVTSLKLLEMTDTMQEARFGMLKHIGSPSRLAEISLVCGVDVCRAATYIPPGDDVPLRLLAYDIAHEIKSALSSATYRKFYHENNEEVDIPFYAEAFVALYRFLPPEDSVPLFMDCLRPEKSDAIKTAPVRAFLTLVQEAAHIPWQRPLDQLEESICNRLHALIISTILRRPEKDEYGNKRTPDILPRAKQESGINLPDREVLVLGILSLYRARPQIFFQGLGGVDANEWMDVTIKLWDASLDLSVKISMASTYRTLTSILFKSPPDNPHLAMIATMFKLSLPITLMSVANNLISCRGDVENQRLWIALAYQILELYAVKTDISHVREIQNDAGRLPALAMSEMAFIISLTSIETGISQLSARSLRLLAHIERQPDFPKPTNPKDIEHRLAMYERLGDPKIMVVGRVGHQKRIRKLIRSIAFPPDVHSLIWSECFWRWRSLTESLCETLNEFGSSSDVRRGSFTPSPETRFQWQNYTLFLAAIAGSSTSEPPSYTKLVATIPRRNLPDGIRVLNDFLPLVDAFLSDLTTLLLTADAQIRDIAKEALGAELGPKLYGKLFGYLEMTLKGIEQNTFEEPVQNFLQKLDQFITILKHLLESSHTKTQDYAKIDVGLIFSLLASLISRFPGNEASRIKVKFCGICDTACDSQEPLILRKDTNQRHLILDIILEWIKPTSEADQYTLQCDLNMACLKTAVKLLEQLQLQPPEGTSPEDDCVHVASRLFNRYSGALLHGLDTYYNEDAEVQMRELVVTGLTHLVSANAESGLRQCLSLAYDKDKKRRALFAHVFARVIRQGTRFERQDRSETQARRNRLCELVKGSDLMLALTICEVCPHSEVEIIVSVLLNLFDNRAMLTSLLKMMIQQEIDRTEHESGLFRSNSTCARFLSAFARIHGYNYLRNLIQPLIKSMLSMPSGCSYELDPSKAKDQDLSQNQKNIEFIASSFLTLIGASIPALPAMFREICAYIGRAVSEVWPESKFPALGAFIFLRFISPAVVSPEIVDVELPKDESAHVIRRGLMVIAKILQNLANNIFFGKEAYMVVLNKFLEENITNVTRYLSEVIKNPTSEEDSDQWLGNASDETDVIVLHRFFVKHADKIGRELLSLSKPSQDGTSMSTGKQAWDELCALLVDLKSPFEAPTPATVTSDMHEGYKQLMTRYSRRDTQSVQDIFVECCVPAPKSAFFVFHLSKIDVESLDIELLMYHIFKILSTYEDQQFELILDCTSFSSNSEIPLQWVKYCAELIPMDIRSRIIRTHVLNPNSLAQKYLRRLYNVSAGTSFCGEIRIYPSTDLLSHQVPEQVLIPLAYAVSLEKESRQTFVDVTMKTGYIRMPVTLEIAATHLRITSISKTAVSQGVLSNTTEVIPLTDISDIYNVSTGQDLNEFIIRRSRQAITMYFASPDRDVIVKRFSRYSNVPAILLHVAFSNVDFDDDQLRSAAYDLLGAVCSYLEYDKNVLVDCNTGFVPGNYSTFVLQLSERLAQFAPSLTLDFLYEVSESMNTTDNAATAQQIHCLNYLSPWIKNLSYFANATHDLFERSGARLRDCIRTLAHLSIFYPQIEPLIHRCIWNEVAKLDSFVIDVVLDELIRMAVDGGVGSSRCDAVAKILTCLSSIGVRAKVYFRLRKTLGKISPKASNALTEHTHWPEISALLRLALAVSPQSKHLAQNQFHVPEIIHLATLVAGAGPTSVRKCVYGIVMNLLQSIYMSRSDDIPGEELHRFIKDCATPCKLKLFGLHRETSSSDHETVDPTNERDYLDTLENLTLLLSRVMELTSGSTGLLNVWRARWMSLITSTSFQLSPAVQIRSFIAMGTLATNDVDDDMLYQLLVALRNALYKANESQTLPIVSMLRCLRKMVPSLQQNSRYIVQLFWLAIALLQSSHMAFYEEATCLLRVSLEKMEADRMFYTAPMHVVLLEGRIPLDEVSSQLDEILKLSFETNFSFSLASIVFKGIRHTPFRNSAQAALRSLLSVTMRSRQRSSPEQRNTTLSDALGYFLALLPLSTSGPAYRRLLEDCHVDDAWIPQPGIEDDEEENLVPRVSPLLLGITDSTTALLATSFVGVMLTTAQGDDAESELLYMLLCNIAVTYPDIVALVYEHLQEKVKDTFANSSNVSIIRAVSEIYTVSVRERLRFGLRDSSSTLGIGSDDSWKRRQFNALDEIGMLGLANSFAFLPRDRGHATKMINWIPALIERIIG
ncbi:hypothetical protein M378DRAFT_1044573 [Amanita muscaria Koide BX008]|uniref:Ras-GAP domain-containing protein n=1 Tax=Amanita muscaria (strain Koide BX008) TaxID=946122 RepID=A0A0C2X7Z4_AMAMK|nr:hypothetical protein M378DRAFT_1044573 [Amanita muscaria Koide BX008]